MTPPLNPVLFSHLRRVQQSTNVGLHSTCHGGPRSSRTVYRWQRSLGDQLLVIPNIEVEALGLRHAHVFSNIGALSLPYAVESAIVTPDFCQETVYVHCLVPTTAMSSFEARVQALGETTRLLWSRSGWQQFLATPEAITLPVHLHDVPSSALLRRLPFVVPAMLECWQYPNSLPLAWHRIKNKLGPQLKAFLPRTKIRYVNGMTHLTQAFRLLQAEGLVRQQVIRYHPLLAASVEVFLVVRLERDDLAVVLEGLRASLHAVETYPTKDGYWCRLLGPHRLLDAIINLPSKIRERCAMVYFHTKRQPTPHVRFSYEQLFEPRTGTWRTA